MAYQNVATVMSRTLWFNMAVQRRHRGISILTSNIINIILSRRTRASSSPLRTAVAHTAHSRLTALSRTPCRAQSSRSAHIAHHQYRASISSSRQIWLALSSACRHDIMYVHRHELKTLTQQRQ